MKVDVRRRISALILLAIYLPMLLLAGLHIHPELALSSECHQCVSHQPHAGHISSQGAAHHDCVLCQFRTLPALEAQTTSISLFIPVIQHHYVLADQPVVCMNVDSLRSRAPPSCI
ncbi:MAG: hypothetical protein K6F20_01735 [Bacteroidaceae bacterium]|nr:hypothetical protein [Bacteroidaceae bacterium]